MIDPSVTKKVLTSLKRYTGKESARLRNDFSAITSDALSRRVITHSEAALLTEVRSLVETWNNGSSDDSAHPVQEWIGLYQRARDVIPSEILQLLLGRLPKNPGPGLWDDFVLSLRDEDLVDALLNRHKVKPADLKRLAKAAPEQFYRSAALDVLLQRRQAFTRAVWKACENESRRPSELLSAEDALLQFVDVEGKSDTEKWFMQLLSRSSMRESFWRRLLLRPKLAFRFTKQLTDGDAKNKGKGDNAPLLIAEWTAACLEILDRKASGYETALLVLGLLRLAARADSLGLSAPLRTTFERGAALTERLAVEAIQAADSQNAGGLSSDLLVLSPTELSRSVHKYLELLAGNSSDGTPSDRSTQYERYQGRREVVESLLTALEEDLNGSALRDAVEVALFNAGVRTVGAEGDDVEFDYQLHQAVAPGILPGDRVLVIRAGRVLGSDDDAVVLRKAQVRPSGHSE